MKRIANRFLAVTILFLAALFLSLIAGIAVGWCHDMEHPEEDAWYANLKQPDNPNVSCCGIADAYWCDGVHVRNGTTYCVITDDRVIPNRTPVPVGTEIEIPDRKLTWKDGNPTGHAIVFLSSGGAVYCFVQNGGS